MLREDEDMASQTTSRNDTDGVAYGRPPAQSNALLTQVGPGTPCGEFMRRYWQPLLAAAADFGERNDQAAGNPHPR
jgi:hypothetical protein